MKVKFGMMITDGVNKLGGHVVQSNAYGRFARTLVTPSNPSTDSQVNARASVTNLVAQWRSLSAAQRFAWSEASPDFPNTNGFGDTFYDTGYNLFMRLNLPLNIIYDFNYDDPPSVDIPMDCGPIIPSVAADGSDTTIEFLTINDNPFWYAEIWASGGLSPGINYVSTRARWIGDIQVTDAGVYDLTSQYFAKFGAPGAGKKVYFRVKVLSLDSGQYSVPVQARVITV